MKIDVFWPHLEDIAPKFHLFPLKFLVGSDPSPAHFLCNFQNLILLQLTQIIYEKIKSFVWSSEGNALESICMLLPDIPSSSSAISRNLNWVRMKAYLIANISSKGLTTSDDRFKSSRVLRRKSAFFPPCTRSIKNIFENRCYVSRNQIRIFNLLQNYWRLLYFSIET